MCRNQDIVNCIQDLAGQHSPGWSYARGSQSWSIASKLGYPPDRVVDASDGGEQWKDAFDQAVRVMGDPEVETVFIGLGANDVCQARGHNYSGNLEVVASLIDETLNYLTSTLPPGGSIYWSGLPNVVAMRGSMRNRDHNMFFENCQATWDLDSNDVKHEVAEDACDHYFNKGFCETAGGQGQAVDLLVELLIETWLELEGTEEGPCGKVLNSGSTDQDRLEAQNFTVELNRLMAEKARAWSGRNGIEVHYNDRLFYASPTIQPHHISRFDCFHPSRSGQMKFAYEIWSGFNHGNEQIKTIFIDEFDSTDYCTQEFGDWGSCWTETNDDNAATSGDIQIAGNQLSMRRGSKQISRAMDLQYVDQAWISFNRRRDNLDHLGDFVNFQISPDAGQTWNQLDHFVGEATDFGFHRGSYYDISQYATADTHLRFISSDGMGENDWLFFDNVKVNSWDSIAASQAAPVYGELLLDENWQAVDTPTTDSPPMVFMGVVTDSSGGTGVAVVKNVGTDHFEVQLQELNETGGDVSAERVSYLVLQAGTYVMPDGSHWEVGSFDIGAEGTWQSQLFKTPFADRPFLFLSLQTANNAELPVLRVKAVDTAGFQVALFEQMTGSTVGSNETAAYLAIHSPGNSGAIRIADTYQSYRLQREVLDGAWTPVLDTFLRRQDGVSKDDQINAETHDVVALGAHVFAQQVSDSGSDLAVPQRISAVDLSGTVQSIDDQEICAMVLASGKFTFSCNPVGVFSLTGLLRENDTTVKRQIYADGFFPKIDVLPDSADETVVMTRSGTCPKYNPQVDPRFFPDSAGKWIDISGSVEVGQNGDPVCAMVLANGKYMFSCDGTGNYVLNIPLDANGQFKLQVYADGFAPTIQTLDEFKTTNIVRMARAVECQ
jgi:hypothetical protein